MKLKLSLLMTVVLALVLVAPLVYYYIRPAYNTISLSYKKEKAQERQNTTTEKTFYEIASWAKSLKAVFYNYQCIYEEALKPFRYKSNVKILEIGLGCSKPFGPGSSYRLWNSYFLDAKIYFFEFDKACGESWYSGLQNQTDEERKRLPVMIYGDQMERTVLQEMVNAHGGWNIIVDAYSEYMVQFLTTFEELWPSVLPNGYYFIENLGYSSSIFKGGTRDGLSQGERETAITMIARLFASSIKNEGYGKILKEVVCCDQICGLHTYPKYV